jgi:hypothetical protein
MVLIGCCRGGGNKLSEKIDRRKRPHSPEYPKLRPSNFHRTPGPESTFFMITSTLMKASSNKIGGTPN